MVCPTPYKGTLGRARPSRPACIYFPCSRGVFAPKYNVTSTFCCPCTPKCLFSRKPYLVASCKYVCKVYAGISPMLAVSAGLLPMSARYTRNYCRCSCGTEFYWSTTDIMLCKTHALSFTVCPTLTTNSTAPNPPWPWSESCSQS